MHQYDKILENAIANVEKASLKNRELYKNHEISPQATTKKKSKMPNKVAELLREKIAYGSNLKFDIFNGSDNRFYSASEFVRIVEE